MSVIMADDEEPRKEETPEGMRRTRSGLLVSKDLPQKKTRKKRIQKSVGFDNNDIETALERIAGQLSGIDADLGISRIELASEMGIVSLPPTRLDRLATEMVLISSTPNERTDKRQVSDPDGYYTSRIQDLDELDDEYFWDEADGVSLGGDRDSQTDGEEQDDDEFVTGNEEWGDGFQIEVVEDEKDDSEVRKGVLKKPFVPVPYKDLDTIMSFCENKNKIKDSIQNFYSVSIKGVSRSNEAELQRRYRNAEHVVLSQALTEAIHTNYGIV